MDNNKAMGATLPQCIREQLSKPLPQEAISALPGRDYLSTIKAIYIVERLNDVFGIGGWTLQHEVVSDSDNYITMRGRIFIFNYNIATPYQYGGHSKARAKAELADAYKGAVTDIQSKCASYLEIGIQVFKGQQTHKNNGQAPKAAPAKSKPAKPKPLTPEFIEQLTEQLTKVNNIEELEMLWEMHPDHQGNPDFKEAIINKKKELINT